ncbi:DNA-directed RNA polymerases II 24 kDa polypeptide (RNA polymerase II subunit 5) [Tulasnella sp. 330]|nr:DNA-directed RNA polymerases II 24 kDa polypeptide (RNA polymerase II subunit 5) [Tulasnella sp. 330]KAG8885698.1 DNA-directed RNA polymerases II 24 kDa polypeptide (RNA polymerase II subunit 5) [Tulasnella sp. 331]KAG8890861.1 DNA-directed RNA polymerases II 24 kDa polypeptide (RNA polymerase II subunit 5) [Tulasnella sp. 332]
MADDEREVARLWKINRTIHELVQDRGYDVSDDELAMDLQTFRETYARNGPVDRTSLNFFTSVMEDPSKSIFIFFSDEKNVGIKTMKKFIGILEEKKIGSGIIIYSHSMTPSSKKVISSMAQQFRLEEFPEADLLVNITHHKLVPRHEVLSNEEKQLLLERYRLRETQLPRIMLSDPVARYYGLRRGQVVKITRPSETSGRYASYRIAF